MTVKPVLLTIGIDPETESHLKESFLLADIRSLPFDLEQVMEPLSPEPLIAVVQTSDPAVSIEMAQTLRMMYPGAKLYLCSTNSASFERKSFIKNGFNDAFLLPLDLSSLKIALNESISIAGSSEVQAFRSVKLLDLDAGESIDFDTSVYLPANKKYVKITNAGDSLDQAKLEKIKKNKVNNLYVPAGQIQKFYDYSAKKLQKLGSSTTMSATERREKLAAATRELISGMFSQEMGTFQSGKEVLKNCSGIISSYIVQGGESEWFLRIQQLTGDHGDQYSHAGNVSTLAALFSLGLGIGKPEDLALAGLLHDIGKAHLRADVQTLEREEMNPEQLAEYKRHPELSIQLIKEKKIVVPDIVTKAILQHHELFNGSGFPSGLFGDRICKEAQILSLADRFDHLTKLIPGRPLVTPREAVNIMKEGQVNDPSKIEFDPTLLSELIKLLTPA